MKRDPSFPPANVGALGVGLILSLLAGGLAGCSSPSAFGELSPNFPDNRVSDLRRALDGARTQEPTPPWIVGATEGELFAYDLGRGRLAWRLPAELRGVPYPTGRYVTSQERRDGTGMLVLRRLSDGAEVLTIPDEELHLVGAGGEGEFTALSLSTGGGVGARSRLIVTRGASILWEIASPLPFGGPTVAGQRVFLPWSHQNLSIFDIQGSELARLRVDGVLGASQAMGGHIYAGQLAAFRVDEALAGGRADAANMIRFETVDLPGTPSFFGRSYDPPDPPSSATHRIRLEWAVDDENPAAAFDRGQVYLSFFRALFAIEAATDAIRWARVIEHDVVGAQALGSGLLVVDAGGHLRFIRPESGKVSDLGSLGLEPLAARVRATGWSPPGSVGPDAEAPSTLGHQLATLAEDTDARLVPAQTFAIAALASRQDAEATGHLVSLCDRTDGSAETRGAACNALGSRTVGPEAVLTALERHGRFLNDIGHPPVGALANAAEHLQEHSAVPLLVEHLSDPRTAAEDLPSLFKALATLGDREAALPVRKFIRLYHADVAEPALEGAVAAALAALTTLEGEDAQELLDELLNDPLTDPQVRAHTLRTVAELRQSQEDESPEDGSDTGGENDPEEISNGSDEPPERMSSALVELVLRPVAAQLRRCLGQTEGHPQTGRLVLVFDTQSRIETISVLPQAATGCIAPLVRAQEFPQTRHRHRQQITYTFHR